MESGAKLALPPPFEEALSRHEREIMRFLMRMTRDQLADAAALFGHSGTIHSLLHFIWFCGFRRIWLLASERILGCT